MNHITLNDIYVDGVKYSEDNRKIIYLTPGHPLKFDSNTWIYKKNAHNKSMDRRFERTTGISS